jgi:cytochrome c
MFQMTDAQVAQQEQVDAKVWAIVKNDPVDPTGFFHECEEHGGNMFLTYCVVCPEGEGNGKRTKEQMAAALEAVFAEMDEVPF